MVLFIFCRSWGECERHQFVSIWEVFSCNNFYNSRHSFCFGDVDVDDFSVVSNSWHYQFCVQSGFRHVQSNVFTVVTNTASLSHSVWSNQWFAIETSFNVFGPVVSDVFESLFASQDSSSFHYSVNDLFVTSTTANVSVFLEPVTYIFSSWVWIFLQ